MNTATKTLWPTGEILVLVPTDDITVERLGDHIIGLREYVTECGHCNEVFCRDPQGRRGHADCDHECGCTRLTDAQKNLLRAELARARAVRAYGRSGTRPAQRQHGRPRMAPTGRTHPPVVHTIGATRNRQRGS